MDKVARYEEGIYKEALNAGKARVLAKQVGLFPEGNWKSALRKLRGKNGELLQGKELMKAKQKMGAMPNNTYQTVKRDVRKYGDGSNAPTRQNYIDLGRNAIARNDGTEIGGLFRKQPLRTENGVKRFKGARLGDWQSGDVDNIVDRRDLSTMQHFHTHPNKNRYGAIQRFRKQIRNSDQRLDEAKRRFNEAGFDRQWDGQIRYNSVKSKTREELLTAALDKEIARLNYNNKAGGKNNPLISTPSGYNVSGLDTMSKEQREAWRKKTEHQIANHNKSINQLEDGTAPAQDKINRFNAEAKSTLVNEQKRNVQQDPNGYLGGDLNYSKAVLKKYRTNDPSFKLKESVLTPEVGAETVHKTSRNDGTRLTYFDRRPRAVREAEANSLKKKMNL